MRSRPAPMTQCWSPRPQRWHFWSVAFSCLRRFFDSALWPVSCRSRSLLDLRQVLDWSSWWTSFGWAGTGPEGFSRLAAPTPYLWVIGRTKTDGVADYPAVNKIQAGYKVTPLSRWGKEPEPVTIEIDPAVDMKTPPKIQVDTMSAAKYFAHAAELLKVNPPHLTDEPILAQMQRIDPAVRKASESAPEDAQQLMKWKIPTLARIANGWSMNTDTMGVYGNYYLKRAIVAQLGLGANLPEDAIYPINLFDDTGKPLDGANQ